MNRPNYGGEAKMTALPGTYKGVTFRSRTKARWAIYLDLIGVDWQYEPEAYILPDESILGPDFRCMPRFCSYYKPEEHDFFLTIKPTKEALDVVSSKVAELARCTGLFAYGIVGPPSLSPQRAFVAGTGEECCSAIFCRYAFITKGWAEPYFGEDDLEQFFDPGREECDRARNARFDLGIAVIQN